MTEKQALAEKLEEILCSKDWALDKSDVQELLHFIEDNFDVKWKPGLYVCPGCKAVSSELLCMCQMPLRKLIGRRFPA